LIRKFKKYRQDRAITRQMSVSDTEIYSRIIVYTTIKNRNVSISVAAKTDAVAYSTCRLRISMNFHDFSE